VSVAPALFNMSFVVHYKTILSEYNSKILKFGTLILKISDDNAKTQILPAINSIY
jgi:hypothetical protein